MTRFITACSLTVALVLPVLLAVVLLAVADASLLPAPSCPLSGSAELLDRALENVVRNALKHVPPGGRVGIELLPEIVPGRCGVLICDNGPGVPADDLAAIFRGGHGERSDGHGLGLAIARRVVELHGGTIAAANRSSGGLCVSIALPWMAIAERSPEDGGVA